MATGVRVLTVFVVCAVVVALAVLGGAVIGASPETTRREQRQLPLQAQAQESGATADAQAV